MRTRFAFFLVVFTWLAHSASAADVEPATAMARMKGVRPVRSHAALRHTGSTGIARVAFSHDGKLLATTGQGGEIRLWNTADWTSAAVIQQEGTIVRILFSPDDRFLYAARGDEGPQVLARFDTRTGKLDKAYQGHPKGIHKMELSPDGRSMVTSGHYEDVIHFWDTESGKVLRTIDYRHQEADFFLSPDGKGIVRPGEGLLKPFRISTVRPWRGLLTPFRGEDATQVSVPTHGGVAWAASDPTVVYCTYQEWEKTGYHPWPTGRGHVAWGRWDEDGWRQVGDKDLGRVGLGCVAIAPSGKLLAAAGNDQLVRFYSLPQLDLLGQVTFVQQPWMGIGGPPGPESSAFSPDGKLLALGMGNAAPGLIRTDPIEKLWPYDGHGDSEVDVFFTADGKQLRSYGADNTVCTWDAATMKMLRRDEIPPALKVIDVRQPDGRYAICFDAALEHRSFERFVERSMKPHSIDRDNEETPAQVFDAEAGRCVAKVALPVGHFNTHVYWIDDREALVETEQGFCRFNYQEGKVLGKLKLEGFRSQQGGELTEDGRSICFFNFMGKSQAAVVAMVMMDVATGKITTKQHDKWQNEVVSANCAGLVPGGKYCYFADPSVYIYDRQTLTQVSKMELVGTRMLSHSFSGDGRRYALVTRSDADAYQLRDPKIQTIVRIHETLTGKTLFAFPASTRWASVKLSGDGNRMAIVNDDGTTEVWTLPAES
jgi:WD40 repeat protein